MADLRELGENHTNSNEPDFLEGRVFTFSRELKRFQANREEVPTA
jgi:hypothetical protein